MKAQGARRVDKRMDQRGIVRWPGKENDEIEAIQTNMSNRGERGSKARPRQQSVAWQNGARMGIGGDRQLGGWGVSGRVR